jgi:hypothetical protein
MKYTVEFLYSDNNQLYQDMVELSPEEHDRVKAFLLALEKAGHIEAEGGGSEMIYPYHPPIFLDFGQLEANWQDGLLETAKDYEITL